MLQKIFFDRLTRDTLWNRLVKIIGQVFVLTIVGLGLGFAKGVLLARVLGVTEYGAYSYVIAWVSLLAVLASLGLNNLLVRELAKYQSRKSWALLQGLLRWANLTTFVLGLGLALLMAGIATLFISSDGYSPLSFWIAALILPLTVLITLQQAALRGLHRIVLGQLTEKILHPIALMVLLLSVYVFLGNHINFLWALGSYLIASIVAFLVGTWLLVNAIPQEAKRITPAYEIRVWLHSAFPLLLLSGIQIVNAKIATLMLGAMVGSEAVAFYDVANRGAALVLFFLAAVNVVIGPTLATLHATGDMAQLQQVITRSSRLVLLVSFPVVVGLILFGDKFLILFGSGFLPARMALTILSLAQLVNIGMGSVGLLLTMTGYERNTIIGFGVGVVLNIALCLIFIPRWSFMGAAIAAAVSMIIWNLILVIQVYRKLGIHSTALGSLWVKG